jgi:hypothetical protein
MTRSIADQALAYARHGWPVFPCRPGSKEPATSHGFLDATTDPNRIRRWWERQPAANLAIATGAPGPDVLDIDQHGEAGSGFAALNRLIGASMVDTDRANALVVTPSGGAHLYYAGSDQHSGKLPRHHLDFRAVGGYIVAPPSEIGGRLYRVVRHTPQAEADGLDWTKVTGFLEPARTAARQPSRPLGEVSRLAAWMASLAADSHNRNDGLFWAACRAAEVGDEAVLASLAAAARATGLNDREIARTIDSARRTAGRRPFEHNPGREVTR